MKVLRAGFFCCVAIAVSGVAAAAVPDVYITARAGALERQASLELQRYLYAVLRDLPRVEIVENVPPGASGFVVGTPETLPGIGLTYPFGLEPPSGDGYLLRSISEGRRSLVVVAAPTAKGVLNGVYGLLEEMGYGFYLGGDTLPSSVPSMGEIAGRGLSVSKTPAFSVRGSLPWFNFLNSPTTWELGDYQWFFDQLTHMRCNFAGFHVYDNEPFAAYEFDGQLIGGEPLQNTSDSVWGTHPIPTSEFYAGTGQYFDSDVFGAASSLIEDRAESVRASKEMLRSALAYAKGRGLNVCLGFELTGDPLDPATQTRFEARLKALLADYPMLDYVWLWESEAMGVDPGGEPALRTPLNTIAQRFSDAFSGVNGFDRQAEAARLTLFGLHAYQVLEALRPDVRLVMSGWGGDEWLHCSDFYPGMDKLMPDDVVFSALDNIDVTPNVSAAYGQLSPSRQRWPIVWFEFDGDQWAPQPNLEDIAGACRDALGKGAQGLLGIHWRTRDVEEAATFCARFGWDTTLTPVKFNARRAADLFGGDKGRDFMPYLERLQNLGYRWVGGAGQAECGAFTWPGSEQAKQSELAAVGLELQRMVGGPSLPETIARGVTRVEAGLVPLDKGPLGLVLSATFRLNKPEVAPVESAVDDMVAQVGYVLAWTAAAEQLNRGSQFQELIDAGRLEDAANAVESSPLAEALHLYAGRMRTKGELGVLATINAKAWADVRARANFPPDTLARLQALPERFSDKPQLIVMPDRVIFTGAGEKTPRLVFKARALGAKRFSEATLPRMGRNTYRWTLPESVETGAPYEYGIEARSGHGIRLSWPPGFPAVTATGVEFAAETQMTPAAPKLNPVRDVKVQAALTPDLWRGRLTWETQPGETYTVSRDGKPLATVAQGWFEDAAPPSNATVQYEVVARNVATGETASSRVALAVPELPLPHPPAEVHVTSRANRIVAGWNSDEPTAAQYYILKYNRTHEVIEETFVDADYGHFLQISDQVEPGQPYTYTVSAVAADGRIGPPSKKVGIISSTEPLSPVLQLSFKDEQFLAGLAQLTERGIALGGRGWAELPPQPQWDPGHALTVSIWVKLDDLAGMPVLVCKGSWQKAGYFLQVLNGKVRFYLAGVDTLDAGALKPGEWQHVVATFGFNEMRVYIDGKLADRKHVTGRPRGSSEPLLIGRYGANEDAYFVRGQIDDVRIYDVPLTVPEITALYEETRAHG